jgi:hypothetical protein
LAASFITEAVRMSACGTQLPSADAASCPYLADADIRVLNEESGFDPDPTFGPLARQQQPPLDSQACHRLMPPPAI